MNSASASQVIWILDAFHDGEDLLTANYRGSHNAVQLEPNGDWLFMCVLKIVEPSKTITGGQSVRWTPREPYREFVMTVL